MYYFTADTIVQANKNIEALDPKVGGLLCVLHCLAENIQENVSYTIDGVQLRRQLSFVFDKEPKDSFDYAKPSYIIFAKNWASTFFDTYIRGKVDLLSCAVFFYQHILLLSLALFDYANHTILKSLLCIGSYQMLRKSHLFFPGV